MDWLKLTEEEIDRVEEEAKGTPLMPAVIKLTTSDLSQPASNTPSILRVTDKDLAPVPPLTSSSLDVCSLERFMFDLINEARSKHLPRWLGNSRLAWHERLAAVARGHSADMLQRQYLEHKSPEGVTAAGRIEEYGIRYIACGENIGIVYADGIQGDREIEDIHRTFMDQPLSLTNHRGNMLNPIWTHVGIGVAYRQNGPLIATQNFISAPGN